MGNVLVELFLILQWLHGANLVPKQVVSFVWPNLTQDTFFDDIKHQLSEQAQRNRTAFEGMDQEQRIAFEGVQPGTYTRIEIKASLVCLPPALWLATA